MMEGLFGMGQAQGMAQPMGGVSPQQKVAQAMQQAKGLFPQNPLTNLGFAAAQAYRQRQLPNPMQRPAAPAMDFNPLTAGQ